jgi:GTPase SAR1 family protein
LAGLNLFSIFVITHFLISESSFKNVLEKWYPELNHHCPGAQILLVGTQADMRTDLTAVSRLQARGQTMISREKGEELCKKINAASYVECSALTQEGMKQVFDEAIRLATTKRPSGKSKSRCLLL